MFGNVFISQIIVSLKTNSNISSNPLVHFYLKIQSIIHVVPFQCIIHFLCLHVVEHISTFSAYSLEIQLHFLLYSFENLDYYKLNIIVIFIHRRVRKPASESALSRNIVDEVKVIICPSHHFEISNWFSGSFQKILNAFWEHP